MCGSLLPWHVSPLGYLPCLFSEHFPLFCLLVFFLFILLLLELTPRGCYFCWKILFVHMFIGVLGLKVLLLYQMKCIVAVWDIFCIAYLFETWSLNRLNNLPYDSIKFEVAFFCCVFLPYRPYEVLPHLFYLFNFLFSLLLTIGFDWEGEQVVFEIDRTKFMGWLISVLFNNKFINGMVFVVLGCVFGWIDSLYVLVIEYGSFSWIFGMCKSSTGVRN